MSPRSATAGRTARRPRAALDAGSSRLAAVVLAAGYSSRMRRFKPLLAFGEATVLERAVRTFTDVGIRDVVVVTGHQGAMLLPAIDRLGARRVVNAAFDRGMYSSVQAGVAALAPEVEACFFLPADMPAVRGRTVELLAAELLRTRAPVVYPAFRGSRGHPPLVARRVFPAILASDGEGGLRAVLGAHEARARTVDVLDEGVTLDLDTPADYRAARGTFGDRTVPTECECAALLEALEVHPRVVQHSRAVADVAARLARALAAAGVPVNAQLARAAGLLHDVAKGQPDHAGAAAEVLDRLGLHRVAAIVKVHMDLPPRRVRLDEAGLLFLADKLVWDDRVVPLAERLAACIGRFGDSRAARAGCARRFARAEAVAVLCEDALGADVLTVARGRTR